MRTRGTVRIGPTGIRTAATSLLPRPDWTVLLADGAMRRPRRSRRGDQGARGSLVAAQDRRGAHIAVGRSRHECRRPRARVGAVAERLSSLPGPPPVEVVRIRMCMTQSFRHSRGRSRRRRSVRECVTTARHRSSSIAGELRSRVILTDSGPRLWEPRRRAILGRPVKDRGARFGRRSVQALR